jgi:hypothetical protein
LFGRPKRAATFADGAKSIECPGSIRLIVRLVAERNTRFVVLLGFFIAAQVPDNISQVNESQGGFLRRTGLL